MASKRYDGVAARAFRQPPYPGNVLDLSPPEGSNGVIT